MKHTVKGKDSLGLKLKLSQFKCESSLRYRTLLAKAPHKYSCENLHRAKTINV